MLTSTHANILIQHEYLKQKQVKERKNSETICVSGQNENFGRQTQIET